MKCPFVIKVCTKCKRILVAHSGNFFKDKKKKDGLRSECKECKKKYRENETRICSIEGCNKKILANGLCTKHYKQIYRHGEILERTKYDANKIIEYEDYAEIILYDNNCDEIARILIDLEDIDKIKNYKWYLNKEYARTDSVNNKKSLSLHRLITNCPDDMVVDHINHNTLDNRKCNLRICTPTQNNMNRGIQSNNTSGVTGVFWNKACNKWKATISINKKQIHLGLYEDFEEAVRARKEAEIKYFGEYRYKD